MAASSSAGSTEKSRPSVFWLLGAIVVPFMGLVAKVRIRNPEKLPRGGAYVLAPNHYSEFDPLIVSVASWRLGRAPRFLAKESLFRVPVLGWLLRRAGMVPVSRSVGASRQAIEQGRTLVANARGIIVYPEGTLTRDPDLWPMRGKSGAARIALAAGIPLIPMAQWGVEQIMPRYGKLRLWPPRRPVDVVIGDPVDLSDLSERAGSTAAVQEATDRLMAAITALLVELRGEDAPEERWNPGAHGQNETGRL